MTYNIEFYLSTGGLSADEIADRVISSVMRSEVNAFLSEGQPGGTSWSGFIGSSAGAAEAGSLLLEIHVKSELVGELIGEALAEGAPGQIADTDAFAKMTMTGENDDWVMVRSIWQAFDAMWPMVPFDDGSGFEANISSLP